jgi:hypothetical protein
MLSLYFRQVGFPTGFNKNFPWEVWFLGRFFWFCWFGWSGVPIGFFIYSIISLFINSISLGVGPSPAYSPPPQWRAKGGGGGGSGSGCGFPFG